MEAGVRVVTGKHLLEGVAGTQVEKKVNTEILDIHLVRPEQKIKVVIMEIAVVHLRVVLGRAVLCVGITEVAEEGGGMEEAQHKVQAAVVVQATLADRQYAMVYEVTQVMVL